MYTKMATKIIEKQEEIIGPLALELALKVKGVNAEWAKREIKIEGDQKEVVNSLVKQYEHLFGRASVEACREAVKEVVYDLPKEKVPDLLR